MTKQLTGNFLNELMKLCLRKRQVMELAKQHLKFNYLPSEQYKEVWKMMVDFHDTTEKLLSVGVLSQAFESFPKVLQVVADINKAELVDEELIIDQLEIFMKNKIFMECYDQLHDLFNRQQKEGAFTLMGEVADELAKFKIRDKKAYTTIYSQFSDRYTMRLKEKSSIDVSMKMKIPTGIIPVDNAMHGGIDRKDTALFMAGSGIGKSKLLKYIGSYASRLGFRVVHIQVEGSEREALDAYDTALADRPLPSIEYATLKDDDLAMIKYSVDQIMQTGGEIYLKAYEQFDSASMRDARDFCQEIVDKVGPIDMILLDYLDEIDPGDGKKYSTSGDGERKRREASAKKFKNICVEFNAAGATATQAATRPPSELNDPQFVLTRYHIAEFKGVIKPFSYFITLNQTEDERNEGVMRLYYDKFRKYKAEIRTRTICTNYGREKFYDHQKTIVRFGVPDVD